ncbi:cytidine and dCMP deaminase domain-containing protein 1 [Nematostella vectensis]|uniref:cytidine and dCMP deaminase domain-containing protein 1 n=1 Tax=Nematostella vectensis TaxID=45351 RepID=UPI0020772658|nr:cytidine and dCMP deaminase domain-containing protein 1 [Nematostella vectensis]
MESVHPGIKRSHDDKEQISGNHAGKSPYGRISSRTTHNLRVQKEDLFMVLALFMKESPWADGEPTTGAVYVQDNGRLLSVDCTRLGIHGGVQALIKYPDKIKGCTVYLSSFPCASCAKFLTQFGVKKVYYLPLTPEKEGDHRNTELIFRTSDVALFLFVPEVDSVILDRLETERSQYDYNNQTRPKSAGVESSDPTEVAWFRNVFFDYFGNPDSRSSCSQMERLNKVMRDALSCKMEVFLRWVWGATRHDVPSALSWTGLNSAGQGERQEDAGHEEFLHLSRVAQLLSYASDDPHVGVGCVITKDRELVGFGWNHFLNGGYGTFPQASDSLNFSHVSKDQLKYPFVVHAEQNAIISRNTRDISGPGTTMFATRSPCDECMPLLLGVGVKRFVLPPAIPFRNTQSARVLAEDVFSEKCKAGELQVYRAKKIPN